MYDGNPPAPANGEDDWSDDDWNDDDEWADEPDFDSPPANDEPAPSTTTEEPDQQERFRPRIRMEDD